MVAGLDDRGFGDCATDVQVPRTRPSGWSAEPPSRLETAVVARYLRRAVQLGREAAVAALS